MSQFLRKDECSETITCAPETSTCTERHSGCKLGRRRFVGSARKSQPCGHKNPGNSRSPDEQLGAKWISPFLARMRRPMAFLGREITSLSKHQTAGSSEAVLPADCQSQCQLSLIIGSYYPKHYGLSDDNSNVCGRNYRANIVQIDIHSTEICSFYLW